MIDIRQNTWTYTQDMIHIYIGIWLFGSMWCVCQENPFFVRLMKEWWKTKERAKERPGGPKSVCLAVMYKHKNVWLLAIYLIYALFLTLLLYTISNTHAHNQRDVCVHIFSHPRGAASLLSSLRSYSSIKNFSLSLLSISRLPFWSISFLFRLCYYFVQEGIGINDQMKEKDSH